MLLCLNENINKMKTQNYWQAYDSKGLVYFTDSNDKPLIAPFPIEKLHDFICANYEMCNIVKYLDDNWDDVCLDYWNHHVINLEFFKATNTPNQKHV